MLSEKLYVEGQGFSDAWNFGPDEVDAKPVEWIVEYLCHQRPHVAWKCDVSSHPHEAHILRLDSAKAKARLGWRPQWNLQKALGMTLDWHQAWRQGFNMADTSFRQIHEYEAAEGQA